MATLIEQAGFEILNIPESRKAAGKHVNAEIMKVKNENGEFAVIVFDLNSIEETKENESKSGKSWTFGFYQPNTNVTCGDNQKVAFTINGYKVKPKDEEGKEEE